MHDVYENTVRFEETDAQGIVFYGNYVTYQDEAITAFVGELGYDLDDLSSWGWKPQVVGLDLNYHESATFHDELVNAVEVRTIGETSVEYGYECRRKADDAVLVDGTVTHVILGPDNSPMRVPEEFREAVAALNS